MNDLLDGDFQKFSVSGGAYIREHFFGPDEADCGVLVENLTDEELARLRRGGHDYRKVLTAAYRAATEYRGAPTVVLAKTIKGGPSAPASRRATSRTRPRKLSEAELRVFRGPACSCLSPIQKLKERAVLTNPGPTLAEVRYMIERRPGRWAGSCRAGGARRAVPAAGAPEVDAEFASGSEMAVSTTMAFGRPAAAAILIRDRR